MSWTTARDDLRVLLSDGPKDKLRFRKKLVGDQNGTNKVFKTFEFRRLSVLVGATGVPIGVFNKGVLQTVDSEDLDSGGLVLHTAPENGDAVEGTYYVQWFADAELDGFLRSATQWLGVGSDPTVIDESFRPAALKRAAADAYQKLALRWVEHISETYRYEDGPGEDLKKVVDGYRQMSSQFGKDATTARDDVYKRQGQAEAPAFRSLAGSVREITPRR